MVCGLARGGSRVEVESREERGEIEAEESLDTYL